MMPGMRRVLLAVVAAGSCVSGPSPDLAIDLGHICTKIGLEVRDPALLPGYDVHALAVERSEGERAWALATDGEGRLQLIASPDLAAHDFSEIGSSDELLLLPGAIEGETWVMLDRPGETQVWRVTDGDEGALTASPRLVDFPAAGMWTRRLVFLDQVAYILSVPFTGDASTVEVLLSRLDDALTPEPALSLPLWQSCPEGQTDDGLPCQPPLLSGSIELELLGTTEGGSVGGAAAMIGMYAAKMSEPPLMSAVYTTLVTNVELRSLGPDQPPTLTRRDLPYWNTTGPVVVTPAYIATDRDALYWLAGLVPLGDVAPPDTDFVYGAEHADDGGQARILATAKKDLNSHLLQIGGGVALGQIHGNRWTIAPLESRAVSDDITGALTLDPGATVSLAGRGQFLVRSDGGSRRVAAACAPEVETK